MIQPVAAIDQKFAKGHSFSMQFPTLGELTNLPQLLASQTDPGTAGKFYQLNE